MPSAKPQVCAGESRWYLLQTKARSERRIAQRLGWAGYATALPLVAEPRRDRLRRSRIYTVQVPCFPGYVMVQLDLSRDALTPVIKCEGVKRMFMTAASQPVPIKRGEVERVMEQADQRRALAQLAEGSRVRLRAGPFEDHEGVCLWSSADRLGLLMELLGGAVEVVVPRANVVVV